MPNPLIIGGLIVGGAYAAWRVARERGRVRRMMERLAREAAQGDGEDIVKLERDPRSGVYRPRRET